MQTTCEVNGQSDMKLLQLGAARGPGRFLGDSLGIAEQIFLLRLVEALERQRGGFNVENECGHEFVLVESNWRGNQILTGANTLGTLSKPDFIAV